MIDRISRITFFVEYKKYIYIATIYESSKYCHLCNLEKIIMKVEGKDLICNNIKILSVPTNVESYVQYHLKVHFVVYHYHISSIKFFMKNSIMTVFNSRIFAAFS